METSTFTVPSIACSVCAGKIKGGLQDMSGIDSVNVDLKSQSVNVSYNPEEIKPLDIKKKIMTLGYEVT